MRQISMAKKGRRWVDGTVTRREGWLWLAEAFDLAKAADLGDGYEPPEVELEVVEWSPRVGSRWVCEECGWLGSTSLEDFPTPVLCRDCRHAATYRKLRKVGTIRVLDARREPLSAILTEPGATAAEGFPGMPPLAFIGLLTGQEAESVDLSAEYTRIEYEVQEVHPAPPPLRFRRGGGPS